MDLNDAIAELRRVTPADDPWEAEDFPNGDDPRIRPIDHAIATIINAVLSGDMIPRETHLAAVGAAYQAAAKGRFRATVRHDGAEVGDLPWLEEFWAIRYDAILALAPPDAAAALERAVKAARTVKPLVWRQDATNAWDSGHYNINQRWPHNNGPFSVTVSRGPEVGLAHLGKFHTLESAKAAAQADYTAHIHAAPRANATDASEGER